MAESASISLVAAEQVARETAVRRSPNGVYFAAFGDTHLDGIELERMVQAVPASIAGALKETAYYFVPLAMGEPEDGAETEQAGMTATASSAGRGARRVEPTMVAPAFTPELGEQAICHRNVALGSTDAVFISTRLLNDRFALSFEFFINVGHAFVDVAGVPESFAELAWKQALAEVRGETSQDASESRGRALAGAKAGAKPAVDEKAKLSFCEAAFSDAIAIYLLSLAVDFDYSELREREYPLLAAPALAERLRLLSTLFPPNAGYEFAIRYRRRA